MDTGPTGGFMLPSFGPVLGLELDIGLDSINHPILEVFVHRISVIHLLMISVSGTLSLERL